MWVDLFVYMLACYFRLFTDSHYQGTGRFDLMQRLYILFWFAKILFVLLVYTFHLQIHFTHLATFEFIASLPWIVYTIQSLRKLRSNIKDATFSVSEGFTRTMGGLSRNLWLEIDKILLPIFLDNHAYIQYSLISRVFSAAIIFISSFIASITPKIIISPRDRLIDIIRSGRLTVFVSCFAFLFGTILSFALYKIFSWENLFVALSFFISIPLFYWGSIIFDFIFYQSKTFNRVLLNLLGLFIICLGIFISSYTKNLYPVSISIALSYMVTLFSAQSILNREKL
ncbi:hypothetical protein MF271_01685 (plasmid) [Deinococcus sp. KNUC1210]|uniref:hypothetical protein n=1 Tax=Deinococcus sp. KNUC1210 TaxID=2917691 RepID=UPI001EF0E43F|nr:hypothetical protein [Deinococcus sp. KNUC1210]ULH14258.1 hypothetical protein MF271_01685 [Deinococcus sp. KNUC1210]